MITLMGFILFLDGALMLVPIDTYPIAQYKSLSVAEYACAQALDKETPAFRKITEDVLNKTVVKQITTKCVFVVGPE